MAKVPLCDFVVTAEIYNDAQVAIWRNQKELDEWCSSKGFERKPKAHNASAACLTDNDGVDWFVAYIPKPCEAVTVCHECLHLAWFILRSHGVKVNHKNHEALAYLQQHLARQIIGHK